MAVSITAGGTPTEAAELEDDVDGHALRALDCHLLVGVHERHEGSTPASLLALARSSTVRGMSVNS